MSEMEFDSAGRAGHFVQELDHGHEAEQEMSRPRP